MNIHHSESKIASVGHLVQSSETKSRSTVRILTFIIPAKFGYYWPCICRNIGQHVFSHRVSMTTLSCRKRPRSHLSGTNSGSFVKVIEQSYKVSKYLVLWFQRPRFLKIGQSESKIASGGHLVQSTETKNFRKKEQRLQDGFTSKFQGR